MENVSQLKNSETAQSIRNAGTTAVDAASGAATKVRDYAVEHKTITVVGAVALAAIALGAYALSRRSN